MVDELTQESFQTGKAIVTVSVDLLLPLQMRASGLNSRILV